MIITKNFNVLITIKNISNLINNGPRPTLLELVKKLYVNVCYQNVLIINIIDILKYSQIEFNQSDLACSMNTSVKFSAECIEINRGELLTEFKMINIIESNNTIMCKNEKANIIAYTIPDKHKYKIGDNILLLSHMSKYTLGGDKISVGALEFSPSNLVKIDDYKRPYKLYEITNEQKEYLNSNIIPLIKIEQDKASKLDIKKSKELVYPYKKNNKSKSIRKKLTSLDFDNVIIQFNYEDDIYDGDVIVLDTDIDYIDTTDSEGSANVLYWLLVKYYNYLKMINDISPVIVKNKSLVDTYNDNKL